MDAQEKRILKDIIASNMKFAAKVKERIPAGHAQEIAKAYYDGMKDLARELVNGLAPDRRKKRGKRK